MGNPVTQMPYRSPAPSYPPGGNWVTHSCEHCQAITQVVGRRSGQAVESRHLYPQHMKIVRLLMLASVIATFWAPPVHADDGFPVLILDANGGVWLVADGVRHEVAVRVADANELDALAEGLAISIDVVASAGRFALDLIAPTPTPQPTASVTPTPTVTVTPTQTLTPTVVPTWSAGAPLVLGMLATSRTGGEPGATGDARVGPWSYVVRSITSPVAVAGKPPRGQWIVVTATLTNLSLASGTAGDGRYVTLHDAQGRSYEAVYDVVHDLRRPLGMPTPHDVIWPGETFDTALAYDLPPGSTGLTLSLPFGPVLDVDAVLASTR